MFYDFNTSLLLVSVVWRTSGEGLYQSKMQLCGYHWRNLCKYLSVNSLLTQIDYHNYVLT